MWIPSVNALEIVLRTVIVYAVVLFGLRVFGKRELGQMTAFDLVVVITISNAVQNAMTGGDNSVTGGVLAAMTLLVANFIVSRLATYSPWLRKGLQGEPTLLIHEGHIYWDRMRREDVTEDELLMAAREHELDDLDEIKEAVLETDGTISIIPKPSAGDGEDKSKGASGKGGASSSKGGEASGQAAGSEQKRAVWRRRRRHKIR